MLLFEVVVCVGGCLDSALLNCLLYVADVVLRRQDHSRVVDFAASDSTFAFLIARLVALNFIFSVRALVHAGGPRSQKLVRFEVGLRGVVLSVQNSSYYSFPGW